MAINAKRLLKLADFLETVPRKSFNLSAWQSRPAVKPEGKKQGECGFAGCAIGWAAHAKLFRGLRLVDIGDGYDPEVFFNATESWEAIDELFNLAPVPHSLRDGDAEYLFMAEKYDHYNATPKQVAKRIRKFVHEHSSAQS